jgi:hypothetical protein
VVVGLAGCDRKLRVGYRFNDVQSRNARETSSVALTKEFLGCYFGAKHDAHQDWQRLSMDPASMDLIPMHTITAFIRLSLHAKLKAFPVTTMHI